MPVSASAIDLRHLRYFLVLTEELHFGRAAERLSITQPPLSQAIRRLEADLGVRLFERTSRAVTLTDAGRVLAHEARTLLADFDRAVADTREAGGAGPELRIACAPHVRTSVLKAYLDRLRARTPTLATSVVHLCADEQVRRLQARQIDLGILPQTRVHDGLDTSALLGDVVLTAVLPALHPLADKPALTPEDVAVEHLVMFARTDNPELFDHLLERIEAGGYRFAGVREVAGHHRLDLLLAVASGHGITFTPLPLVDTCDGDDVVRRPLEPVLHGPATVLTWAHEPPARLRATLATAVEAGRDLLREA